MKAAVQQRQTNIAYLAASTVLILGVFYMLLAAQTARADQSLDAQRILSDAWKQFERSASQDPITQQKIATCIGQKALSSDAISGHSTYDPNDWKSIKVEGLDLKAFTASVNQAIQSCQNQSGARRY